MQIVNCIEYLHGYKRNSHDIYSEVALYNIKLPKQWGIPRVVV